MRRKLLLPYIALFVFLTTSCRKTELVGSYAMYEGTWTSSTTTLELKENGRGSYKYESGNVTKYINNGRIVIKNNTLKIKLLFSKKYNIDTPPTSYTDGSGQTYTYMKLDGESFFKN